MITTHLLVIIIFIFVIIWPKSYVYRQRAQKDFMKRKGCRFNYYSHDDNNSSKENYNIKTTRTTKLLLRTKIWTTVRLSGFYFLEKFRWKILLTYLVFSLFLIFLRGRVLFYFIFSGIQKKIQHTAKKKITTYLFLRRVSVN